MRQEVTIREFMSRVVPWPGSTSDPGYVNIHWKSPNPRDETKDFWSGRPVRTLNDFIWWIKWTSGKTIKDIFFCTSLQAQIGKNTKGGPKVMRSKDLALSLKAIWLDVDVKEPPKGYATLEEALAAVLKFVKDAALPPPSALIATGGGLHVYWISDKPLSTREWQPYAEGLKSLAVKHNLLCDAGVTTDAARILRVPGTFNYKQMPLRPVRVLGLRAKELDYDFATSLSFLATIVPVSVRVGGSGFLEGQQSRSSAFNALPKESLSEGLHDETPLDPFPIMKGCAFLRDALVTGGETYSQPMWNLTTLAATFMENGHALAHKMGARHAGYTPASTDALWERKSRERKDRGLGWPSCNAIQASGCTKCASCPHFAKGKSPLNLSAPIIRPTPTGSVVLEANDDATMFMPFGYVLNEDGLVCKIVEQKGGKGEPLTTALLPIFKTRLSGPWVQDGPKALNFITSTDVGNTRPVSIPLELLINGTEMWKILQKQGVIPVPKYRSNCEDFLMSWLSELQKAKAAAQTVPFGWWYGDDGKQHGFVYGGVIAKDDGTETPAGFGDVKVREIYKPVGSLGPWLTACKMVTDQKRPELDAIIAASFAAPLMATSGEYSGLLSAWGASGAGKSTAVKVGLAVWGHPKKAKEVAMSTARSVVQKMGEIRNLPVYWDEIKDEKTQANVFDVFFTGTEGVGPSRLTPSAELRDRGMWQTMLIICSNINFCDYLVKHQPTTDSGMYRVLEYEIKDPDLNGPGRISPMEASRITQELEHNYGVMGQAYSAVLGKTPHDIDEFTRATVAAFGKEVGEQQPERFWTATCGTLLAGAQLANQLGAELDVDALHKFLVTQYMLNRERRKSEATTGGTEMNTEEALTHFLRAHTHRTLFTDTFPQNKGRPPAITILFAPRLESNRGITVQWSIKDRLLRISRGSFTDYLHERSVPPSSVLRGLKDHFGMKVKYATLGANTPYGAPGQEHLLCIPVPEGSSLEDQMMVHSSAISAESEPPNTSLQMPQPSPQVSAEDHLHTQS